MKGRIQESPHARDGTSLAYQALLVDSLQTGTPDSFAKALLSADILELHAGQAGSSTADSVFAEAEYLRYYLRALCFHAFEAGSKTLIVHHGQQSGSLHPEAEFLVGKRISVARLLKDLRTNLAVGAALGLPPGANPGLCARLPTNADSSPVPVPSYLLTLVRAADDAAT